MNGKKILKKKTEEKQIEKNNLSELENFGNSENSDELSDELNLLIGNIKNKKENKSNIKKIINNKIEKEEMKQEINKNEKNDKNEKNNEDFDVGEVYRDISKTLLNYKECKITGEIIKFKITDGNAWIDIKFKEYQITGVFWKISNDKNYNMLKTIKSGDQIKFVGSFSIMKKNLSIYYNVRSMEKFGKGDYLDLYEQYRIKIKEQNIGIPKKKLNVFPYSIGIITSLEGAALQDILQTFRLDNFVGNIIIKNAIVQGSQCPKSVFNAIEWFEHNYACQIDLLMITRGGGSYEDLVGFSNWDLLVKISNTTFITISAVGHQIDNQLSDEVADYKFPTPSLGAKFIVEKQNSYKNFITSSNILLVDILEKYLSLKLKFEGITKNYSNILRRFEIKNMYFTLKKYQTIIDNILFRYNELKNEFYSRLSKIKPTLSRQIEPLYNNKSNEKIELTSVNDFIDIKNDKEIKPKKIEINFIDGKIIISYKIIEYERY
jgi:exodeoxyribonuclease VII large subunit